VLTDTETVAIKLLSGRSEVHEELC